MSITSLVKSMQDIMRKDVGVDGDAQRIAQIVWMIFLKILDDKEQELELLYDDFKSPVPENFRWRNWAADEEGMTGDELLEFVNNELFPALSELQGVSDNEQERAFMIREVFQDSYNYMKSGTLMRQVINKINGIDFNSSEDRHLFNDFYEKFLKDLQSAGNAGEYYTPRAVTQFMVDMVNPQLGEKVLDPASGTGGFLASSLEHLKKQADTVEGRKVLEEGVQGIEKKPLPHVLCVTNLILHDVEIPKVRRDNSLSYPLRDIKASDKVDVVLTNPPFGGEEEDGIQTNFPASFQTKETADLFIALILAKLKDNGRAAVVLPDGFLFGEGVKTRLKEKLVEECNLHTIVRLPNGVFNPYTSIKTNLLFFEKGKSTEEVWYFDHPYPPGQKSYSKTRPMRTEEFDLEKKWWNKREENQYAWKVSLEEIKNRNYNLDISNPYKKEEEQLSPEKAYERYQEASQQVEETKQQLVDELASILGGVEV
ncbi:N-6 DNA methylase [Virgibacillus xinjiangensis]|uniref:site-specific DNA-methyltransferase (adenine-specific) n=1 Tax=Virgibacillus xinjiangensis TaxID=393090 RepID=A0ABV7CV83_9BACI